MSTQPGKSETQTDSVPPRVENTSKKLVKENSAAILKGQLGYCYSQTILNQHIYLIFCILRNYAYISVRKV